MKILTQDEVCEKYGHFELTFVRYYKYRFHFVRWFLQEDSEYDKIELSLGGCPDDIYKFELNETDGAGHLLKHLLYESGLRIHVYDNGTEIERYEEDI